MIDPFQRMKIRAHHERKDPTLTTDFLKTLSFEDLSKGEVDPQTDWFGCFAQGVNVVLLHGTSHHEQTTILEIQGERTTLVSSPDPKPSCGPKTDRGYAGFDAQFDFVVGVVALMLPPMCVTVGQDRIELLADDLFHSSFDFEEKRCPGLWLVDNARVSIDRSRIPVPCCQSWKGMLAAVNAEAVLTPGNCVV
jgi:hypothetical protein